MRVFMDNGVEKVASTPGLKANVIVVNVADGTKSLFANFNPYVTNVNFQDIEPVVSGGAVTGRISNLIVSKFKSERVCLISTPEKI